MARPEGYRKAVRLMELAERRHSRAVDRQFRRRLSRHRRGRARPGGSDRTLDRRLPVARRSQCRDCTGEGMSGGAIAITTANRVLMFEHAIYSVISPEAASSILWRDGTKAQEAANSMKITAQDMLRLERHRHHPRCGGAHRDPAAVIADTGDAIAQAFGELHGLDSDAIRTQRRQKFLDIGRKLG